MKQFLIAFDQLINTIVYIRGDGFGWADETLSARAYRLRKEHPFLHKSIDMIFFFDDNHCEESYFSELNRLQTPPEYRRKKECQD